MITCCRYCTPPKRNPYCHSSCQEYLAQKESHDKEKTERDRKNKVIGEIMGDRGHKVYNALKDRRNKKI